MRKFFAFAILLLCFVPAGNAQTRRKTKSTAPAAPPASPEGAAWPLQTLDVQGNHFYTAQQILAVSGLRLGQPAGKTEFEAARDRLAATGAFDRVGYRFAPAKNGAGYDATIEVTEMPQVYPLRFEDLPAKDAELRAWLKKKDPLFGEKIPATKPLLDRYIKWIGEFLAERNYHEPLIGKLVSDPTTDLTVLFRPAKPRPNVGRVIFTNPGDFPAGMLQTKMAAVAVGVSYIEPTFRTLLDTTIRPLYEGRGMLRVSFPKIETAPSKDVDGVDVTVQVEQGPVYKLGKVSFAGTSMLPDELNNLVKLKPDKTVNFDEVKAGQERIAQDLRHMGYLNASSKILRDVHDKEKTVDLTYQIEPGPQFTMGQLEIVGLDIESEPVIRKMWGLNKGKPFNVDYPDHFLNRVKEGGVFDNLNKTRSEVKPNPTDHTVNVTLYFNK